MPAEPDGRTLHLTLASDLPALRDAQPAVTRFLAAAGVEARPTYATELVFDEIVPNIMRHAFPGDGGHAIEAWVTVERARVVLVFEDDGPAFDPQTVAPPPRPGSLDEARVGGHGLVLVHAFASSIHHERREGRNRLTVVVPRTA